MRPEEAKEGPSALVSAYLRSEGVHPGPALVFLFGKTVVSMIYPYGRNYCI
jgi:hypothetical protein